MSNYRSVDATYYVVAGPEGVLRPSDGSWIFSRKADAQRRARIENTQLFRCGDPVTCVVRAVKLKFVAEDCNHEWLPLEVF